MKSTISIVSKKWKTISRIPELVGESKNEVLENSVDLLISGVVLLASQPGIVSGRTSLHDSELGMLP